MSNPESLWTIAELGALVVRALSGDYQGPRNGQVRAVPDRRTIRYYTTLGLIDRPTETRGRTALYGRRHLLQLVAIKRLQEAGRSLVEIQKQLLGLTTAALGELARLPADGEAVPAVPSRPRETEEAAPERPPGPFWSAPTAPVPATPFPDSHSLVQTLHSIRLTDDAALLLSTSESLDAELVEAVRAAAGPLLQLLETRRLIRPRTERET